MTREFKNLQGKKLKSTKQYMKNRGYHYIVTYNNTNEFLNFTDRFFKTEIGAKKFYNNLSCDKKLLTEF